MMVSYAEERKDMVYYKFLRSLLSFIVRDSDSIIDIGSNGVDMISYYPSKKKVSIDLYAPLVKEGVSSIKGDFLKHDTSEKFDIACCFQVLEHIDDAYSFAQKILNISKLCIVSVPYKWPKGACKDHVQDPVDENKMFAWFKKEPVWIKIIESRMLAIYINNTDLQNEVCNLNNGSFREIFHRVERAKLNATGLLSNISVISQAYARAYGDNSNSEKKSSCFDNPQKLHDKILFLKNDLSQCRELYEIGIKMFPFYVDCYNHPVFLKEYVRLLLENKLFKEALQVFSKCSKLYHYLYGKKFCLILFARAYEKHFILKRSYNIFIFLYANNKNSDELNSATRFQVQSATPSSWVLASSQKAS